MIVSNNKLVIRAVYASIFTAISILIVKVSAWYLTDSSAVLATLLDSFLDIAASCINFVAAKYALQPPDNEHRFGHGKAEDLAVFAQSSFFAMSGVVIIIVAIKKLIFPVHTEQTELGITIMVFSIIVTVFLLLYQTYVYKRTSSPIIKADRFHYSVDLITNFVVILSLYLSRKFHSAIIDPIFAIFIAAYILYGAFELFSRAFCNLLDQEFNEDDRKKVHDLILSHKRIRGYHDLRTRYAGRKPFIQFHLELDGKMSLRESHLIADQIEENILKAFKEADILIHQDPRDEDHARKPKKIF